jgi:hypothetical protein
MEGQTLGLAAQSQCGPEATKSIERAPDGRRRSATANRFNAEGAEDRPRCTAIGHYRAPRSAEDHY